MIHTGTLIEHVWADEPPTNAEDTIASYARTVRRALCRAGGERDWIRSHRPGSYQLNIDRVWVDYHRFAALVTRADGYARDRDTAAAIEAYERAVALRRGAALADVPGRWAENCRLAIENEYLAAVRGLFKQQLAAGAFGAVITRRRADIPDFVTRATHRMRETAGVEPSIDAHRAIRDLMRQPGAVPARPSTVEPQRNAGAGPAGSRVVVMNASHNEQVYQAARDQYIGDA